MSILNVNQIQPVGSGQTVTISATNIDAGSATVTAGTFSGNLSSSGISTFSDTVNVGAGKSIRLYGATSGYSEIVAAAGSASTTFTLPANGGSASQYLQTNGSGGLSWAGVTTGKILQVVQASKTDTTSTASQDSFVDLGLSASITPSSTSSKVLVMVSIGRVTSDSSSLRLCPFRILRGATAIGVGDAAGSRLLSNFAITDPQDNNYGNGGAYQYLDSPSTTSSTTYKIQWTGQAGETWYLHRSSSNTDNTDTIHTRSASHIILMEVAG
jgi:hypothetical protein